MMRNKIAIRKKEKEEDTAWRVCVCVVCECLCESLVHLEISGEKEQEKSSMMSPHEGRRI